MDPSSPAKRRALAPLDANVNAISSPTKLHKHSKLGAAPQSPRKSSSSGSPIKSLNLKRSFAAAATQSEQSDEQNQHSEQQQPEPKVLQVENELLSEQQQEGSRHETPRTRSASPDTSTVFDTSAMDTSQNTTILTEPDAEQARTLPPPRPRRLLTREEARQKARILRLKLGLANYKLQTGQENVPLDKLEVKPRPGQQQQETKTKAQTQPAERALPRVMVQPPSSRDGPPEKDAEEEVVEETETDEPEQSQESAEAEVATTQAPQVQEEKESRNVAGVLPRLEMDNLKAGNDEDEPTSAVSGGIVSSLLSLARGSSSSVSTSS
ncbi:hypothetical protein CSIM01_00386 [Colletotrichum simmondsii]|uniref:Cyclin-dependent kinase n=1 Tax=Colletotrichum simmondsii TaxID=703756 RepID=A0A135SF14_9PEZI|nr:hypothetical protein CSIM01_00386 [Colletotrichum simmondsii]